MSGLRHWPAGEMERYLRAERKRTIDEARKNATTEIRDGRKYRIVRLEDGYDHSERGEPEIQFHRHAVQLVHDLTRGPSYPSGGSPP